MNPFRLGFVIVAGWCLLHSESLVAEDTSASLDLGMQFSSDMFFTGSQGITITQKVYRDNEKIRVEIRIGGGLIIHIIRRDEKKIYSLRPSQNVVKVMAYDPAAQTAPAFDPVGRCEVVGSETVEGVPCTKYVVTSDQDHKGYIWWIDTVHKIPVKMVFQDQSMRILYKNYKAGPQDPSLFEPPAGYPIVPGP